MNMQKISQSAYPGAELTAICDVDEVQLKKVQEEFDVPYTYTDINEMVKIQN